MHEDDAATHVASTLPRVSQGHSNAFGQLRASSRVGVWHLDGRTELADQRFAIPAPSHPLRPQWRHRLHLEASRDAPMASCLASRAYANFFVSGTMSSRGTSTLGTAVFGGDLMVSGGIYLDERVSGAVPTPQANSGFFFLDSSDGHIKFKYANNAGAVTTFDLTSVGGGSGAPAAADPLFSPL